MTTVNFEQVDPKTWRAAATKLKLVTMESEYHVEVFWCK
jgi:hypothetical protein